ncbi:MAG: DUF1501 domain-containing protein [Candidatus Kapabacteria bacterium]|nr:DUF1501 domain-containing protein [Candidatus Kapabacteria bacterium]
MKRRAFLSSAGLSIVAFGSGFLPSFTPTFAQSLSSASTQRKRVLVCIFQRGAMDGLMAVSPFTDEHFLASRNRLRMSVGEKGLLDLNSRFGLHPAFAPFKQFYTDATLGIIHGIGSSAGTRSHFDAQDYMENGTPGRKSSSGWLNRAASALPSSTSPLQLVSLTPALPLSLYGDHEAIAIDDINNLSIRTNASAAANTSSAESFEQLYAQTNQELLRGAGKESFSTMKLLSPDALKNYTPKADARYPASPLGNHLKQTAQLIKMNVGVEIAFVESNGWDTHVQQGTVNGQFARSARDLSESVAAFWRDLDGYHDDVCVMTMTEFGRTVRENGSGGTDHGTASCMFVLGGNVKGGSVYGTVPVLAPENLADGRDLPVTTDFRSLFAGVAKYHCGIKNTASLFPDWNGQLMNVFKG